MVYVSRPWDSEGTETNVADAKSQRDERNTFHFSNSTHVDDGRSVGVARLRTQSGFPSVILSRDYRSASVQLSNLENLSPVEAQSSDTEGSTLSVIDRLIDFSCLTIIKPLRRFVVSLFIWRCCIKWMLYSILTFLGRPNGNMPKLGWLRNLIFGEYVEVDSFYGFLYSCLQFGGATLKDFGLLAWASIWFAIVLLIRVALIRNFPCTKTIDAGQQNALMLSLWGWRQGGASFFDYKDNVGLKRIPLVLQLFFGSVCITLSFLGTVLAIRCHVPSIVVGMHGLLFGWIALRQYIASQNNILKWGTTPKDLQIVNLHMRGRKGRRSLEIAFVLCIASILLFLIISRISFLEKSIRILHGIILIPHLPLLTFLLQRPFLSSVTLTILNACISLFTATVLMISSFSIHDYEIQNIVDTSFIYFPSELTSLLNEKSFFLQNVATTKLFQFSSNAPKSFPFPFLFYSIKGSSASGPLGSATDQHHLTHVFFGTSVKYHQPLPFAITRAEPLETMVAAQQKPVPVPLTSTAAGDARYINQLIMHPRQQNEDKILKALTSLPLLFKRPHTSSFRLKSRLFQCGETVISSLVAHCLPACLLRVLMVGTHHEIDKVASLLFWCDSALQRQSTFFEIASQSCEDETCVCKRGLFLNRWIYEMFFNEASSMWHTATHQLQKPLEIVASMLNLYYRLLISRPQKRNRMDQYELFDLPLECLSEIELIYTQLHSFTKVAEYSTEHTIDTLWGTLSTNSMLAKLTSLLVSNQRIAVFSSSQSKNETNLRRKGSGSNTKPEDSTTNIDEDLLMLTSDFSCRLNRRNRNQLLSECTLSLIAMSHLSCVCGEALSQWIHIAKLLRIKKTKIEHLLHRLMSATSKIINQSDRLITSCDEWIPDASKNNTLLPITNDVFEFINSHIRPLHEVSLRLSECMS